MAAVTAVRASKRFTSYLKLVKQFPLVSIRSQAMFDAAETVTDRLLRKAKLSPAEELYLDALSDLMAAYEDSQVPIPPPTDADLLRHLLDARGITQAELHRDTGIPKSTVSEILSGKKPFSRGLIRRLADYFQVDPGLFSANPPTVAADRSARPKPRSSRRRNSGNHTNQ